MGLTRTSPITAEPVALAEAQDFCEAGRGNRDDLFTLLIQTAREKIESDIGRQLLEATYELTFDRFPGLTGHIWLRDHAPPPFRSVTSITYVDTDGDEQTVSEDDYALDSNAEVGRITLAYNATWPVPRTIADAVTVTFVNGYGNDSTDVPAAFRTMILEAVLLWWRRDTPIGTLDKRLQDLVRHKQVA